MKQKRIIWKNQLLDNLNQLKTSKSILKTWLALLYWCEGSKYPSSTCLTFANSDHLLIKTYFVLLQKAFRINKAKVKIHLQLHTSHNHELERQFWSQLLQIPITQFYKPTVTTPGNLRKRKNYHGTCTIKYFDVKLLLQIIGLYEALGKKITGGVT